jgi:hypothetical protein
MQERRFSDEIHHIARRLVWWKTPQAALEHVPQFLAQVMTFGTWHDVQTVLRQFGNEAFRDTLVHAPPGIFDARSWCYWHHFLGIAPVPPLPKRQLP